MKAANFLCFIGKSFYTRDSFAQEAAHMGISRRIAHNQIPDDLVSGESKLFFADEGGHDPGKPAEVFGYCIPDSIEFIGGTEEDKRQHVHIISRLLLRDDTKILGTVDHEPPRGCGQRKVGGSYIIVDKADSPLVMLDPPAQFLGNHFRGLMRLAAEQSEAFLRSATVSVMSPTKCMTCGRRMSVPPSTLKKAKRAQKKIDEGIGSDWILNCDECKSVLAAAS